VTDRDVPFTHTWSELFDPVITVDSAEVAAPVQRAAADAWVTSSVYFPAVTPSSKLAVDTPRRAAVFDTARRAEVVTTDVADATGVEVRALCDTAN
jgi:hypothetical protein